MISETAPCPHGFDRRQSCPTCGRGAATIDAGGSTLPQPQEATDWSTGRTMPLTPEMAASGFVVPGYEILEELGRGGMGVVFKARQMSVGRFVALKMILSGDLAGSRERDRFRAEAEAVARLQHPNIVQLYEYGEVAGRPYFSLEFVVGGSLGDQLDGRPRPADRSAELVETLARAMHYAHQRGVIHRDLKPANVLLQPTGDGAVRTDERPRHRHASDSPSLYFLGELSSATPKIADFGLAKRLDSGTGHTQTGDVLGTPSYMAPELAGGRSKDVGAATDVYALGAILYQLLTGRPPFRGATPIETMVQVTRDDPVPPRYLRPDLPLDLETITLKCLHKDPNKRYLTAAELSEDLHRWLAGEPIAARPAGSFERLVKWVRRRPAVAALYAVTILMGLSLIGFGVWTNTALRTAYRTAAGERDRARERLVRLTVQSGSSLSGRGEWILALPWFAEALRLEQGDLFRESVHRTRLAVALKQCPQLPAVWFHEGRVMDAAFSPDGGTAATAGDRGEVYIWDVAHPAVPIRTLRFSGEVNRIFFSPSGDRLIVRTGGRVKLRGLRDGTSDVALPTSADVVQAAWSNRGKSVVTACSDGVIRVWDVESASVTATVEHAGVSAVAFSPDGSRLATGAADGSVRLWDRATQKLMSSFAAAGPVRQVAFSPSGHRLLATGGPAVHVWGVPSGERHALITHQEDVMDATFSPDGHHVATASADDTARVWEASTGHPVTPPLKHGSDVFCAAFDPSGRRLVTGGDDNYARIWDAATGELTSAPFPHAGNVYRTVFRSDGRALITASEDGTACLWLLWADMTPLSARMPPLAVIREVETRDGLYRVTVDPENTCMARIWDRGADRAVDNLLRHGSRINSVAISPDQSRVLTASNDNTARVWEIATGEPVTPPLESCASVERAVFSRDGYAVLTVSKEGAAWVWDVATGEAVAQVPRRADWVRRALDGETLQWDRPTDVRPVEQLVALAQWLSGHRVDATGGLVPLTNDELRKVGEIALREAPPGR
jgi:WD40 repeat protein